MKYKQRIITGAFALTLLVGGTSSIKTYAATSTGSSYATSTRNGALHMKDPNKIRSRVKHSVGTITAVSGTGFTFEVHHKHASTTKGVEKVISVDAQTTATTTIKKDGLAATFADLAVGQKVIVSGQIHAADLIINATKVDIVTNFPTKGKGKVKK
ncbi:MAG: hypothetical protein V4686_01590 [Patescibacteria group bacterium]